MGPMKQSNSVPKVSKADLELQLRDQRWTMTNDFGSKSSNEKPLARCTPSSALGQEPLRRREMEKPGSATPGTSTTISSLSTSSLQEGALSVYCKRLRRPFLVDSGADVSVFRASVAQKRVPASSHLQVANGSSIKTFGTL